MKNVKFVPSTCHKLLKLNQDHPSKEVVFLVKSYKIDVMITSVREMTKLPNFGCMTTSAIYFVWRGKFFGDVMEINYDAIPFIPK